MLKNIETGQGHTAVVVAIKIKKREIGISRFFLFGWLDCAEPSFLCGCVAGDRMGKFGRRSSRLGGAGR